MQFVPSTEWASAVGIEKSGAGLIDAPLAVLVHYSCTDAWAKEVIMCTGLTQGVDGCDHTLSRELPK